jgi:hypothetical protein
MWQDTIDFSTLVGKTLTAVDVTDDEVTFTADSGEQYRLLHYSDCCESVTVESVVGEIADLVGSPITVAEEVTSSENPVGYEKGEYQDSFTWTFYKIDTAKGGVTIRWYGESNGYYSESVSFVKL